MVLGPIITSEYQVAAPPDFIYNMAIFLRLFRLSNCPNYLCKNCEKQFGF